MSCRLTTHCASVARYAALPAPCLIFPACTLHHRPLRARCGTIPADPPPRIRSQAHAALPLWPHRHVQREQRMEPRLHGCARRAVGRSGFHWVGYVVPFIFCCGPAASLSNSFVVDNIGISAGFTPSRTQLLLLDFLIITLSVIVTTLAYEAAYARAVTKAAIRATLDLTPAANAHTYTDPLTPMASEADSDLVLDFRSSLLVRHVRHPPSPPPEDTQLPNGAVVVEGLRVLLHAQRALRTQTEGRQAPSAGDAGGDDTQAEERDRRVPGGMDPPEDGG